MNKLFAPDFLIIPYELLNRQNLSPADWLVFSAVYWFEKLKDGRCTAANITIGKVVKLNERTVRRSLEKLEKEGFVKRIFRDGRNKKRSSIKVLLSFKSEKVGRSNPTVGSNDPTQVGLNDPQNKNINKKDLIREDIATQSVAYTTIPELIKEFETINPASKRFYGNTTQRQACEDLIKEYGFERVKTVIQKTLPKTNTMQYFPTIITPVQLRDKWASLESAINKKRSEGNNKGKGIA